VKSTHDEVDLELVVERRDDAADGVIAPTLCHRDGQLLPEWTPGVHVDLQLQPGLVRQYSLCGDPRNRTSWRIGVLLEQERRGGSKFVHDKVFPSHILNVRGPRNHFPLRPSPCYIFIAGGIGITPILPMVTEAQRHGASWTLTYGGRNRRNMAFADDIAAQFEGKATIHPADEQGLLDLEGLLGAVRPDTLVYCCGPEALLDAVELQCDTWPAGSLQLERFAPKVATSSKPNTSFEVELALSGATITVHPNESVLDAVTAHGLDVLSSCREGTCGTCETTVLAGTVDHRDSLLTEEEQAANDTMMICVSRATCPRITLEL
jgi:ferredoxin-NADP reductase